MAEPVVVDASSVVDALVNGRPLPNASLVTPAYLDAEVLSALGRLQRQGVLTVDDVEEMLDDLAALPVQRVTIAGLTRSAFDLRQNVALRDALYVVVAQLVDGPLCTSDGGLRRACVEQRLCFVVQ